MSTRYIFRPGENGLGESVTFTDWVVESKQEYLTEMIESGLEPGMYVVVDVDADNASSEAPDGVSLQVFLYHDLEKVALFVDNQD